MLPLRHLLLLIAFLISSVSCPGRKYLVDSVDESTKERVKIVALKIGDPDYRKFGWLTIEQKGSKYYITFPFAQYLSGRQVYGSTTSDSLPEGTILSLKLGARISKSFLLTQAINVNWYCHWSYQSFYFRNRGSQHSNTESTAPDVYLSHIPFSRRASEPWSASDVYAFSWSVRVELSHEDMLLLSRRKMTEAFVTRNDAKILLPMKKKQAGSIQRSIKDLLHQERKR